MNNFLNARAIRYFILFAFLLRSVLPLAAIYFTKDKNIFYSPDTLSYLKPAREVINTGYFRTGSLPEIVRTPGYPLLLTLGILSKHVEITTIIIQIIISCLTVYLVYKISFMLFQEIKIAISSAALYAMEPLSILYSSKILTETVFTFFTILFIYLFFKYLKNDRFYFIILSSLSLAFSIYIRPVSFYLPIYIVLAMLLWKLFNKKNTENYVIPALFICLFTYSITGIWIVRNSSVADYFGISSISDINLYFYQGAAVIAAKKNIDYYKLQDEMGYGDSHVYFQINPDQKAWSDGKRYRFMGREGLKIILKNPITYAKIHFKGIIRILFDPGATEFLKLFKLYPESGGLLGRIVNNGLVNTLFSLFKENPLLIWSNFLIGLLLSFYYCLIIPTVFVEKLRLNSISFFVLFIICMYFVLISGGPGSLNRFRHPIMPMICVFCGSGWRWGYCWLKDPQSKTVVLSMPLIFY